jgi:Zn-dependent protease
MRAVTEWKPSERSLANTETLRVLRAGSDSIVNSSLEGSPSTLNPRRDMVLVALAGPGMNLLLAIVGTALLAATITLSGGARAGASAILAANALNFVLINIFLALFNLLPVPPFDGGHVVEGLLPRTLAARFRRIGRFSLLVLMILLLVLPALGVNIVGHLVSPLVDHIVAGLLGIFGIRV